MEEAWLSAVGDSSKLMRESFSSRRKEKPPLKSINGGNNSSGYY